MSLKNLAIDLFTTPNKCSEFNSANAIRLASQVNDSDFKSLPSAMLVVAGAFVDICFS